MDCRYYLRFVPLAEGGEQDISIRQYRDLYEHVIHTGLVDMVDIELFKVESLGKGLIEEIKSLNIPLIISSHDLKKHQLTLSCFTD